MGAAGFGRAWRCRTLLGPSLNKTTQGAACPFRQRYQSQAYRRGGGPAYSAGAAASAAPSAANKNNAVVAAAAAAGTPVSPALLTHPVVYHEDFCINPIPNDHRFPMQKDSLLYARLQQLGLAGRTFRPTHPDLDTLCLAHDPQYVRGFLDGSISPAAMRRIGLPWSPELVHRTCIGVGSAIMAARLALSYGVACMTNGGTHHAHCAYGSGWCIFNDQAVAARSVQRDAGVQRILFVDLDVHQGDGTAAIFAGDDSVFTLSLHCEAQPFPHQLQHSDLDVPLPAGTTDEQYMEVLRRELPPVLERFRPELVMYNAGTDVHEDDTLGLLSLSTAGILERDRFVFATAAAYGAPVAAAIGGGYEPDRDKIVDRHVMLHKAATEHLPALSAACGAGARAAAAAARRPA